MAGISWCTFRREANCCLLVLNSKSEFYGLWPGVISVPGHQTVQAKITGYRLDHHSGIGPDLYGQEPDVSYMVVPNMPYTLELAKIIFRQAKQIRRLKGEGNESLDEEDVLYAMTHGE